MVNRMNINEVIAEAKANGISISFDGADGEIVHFGSRDGTVKSNGVIRWHDEAII